ncbi:TRAP transporter large permease subunit [Mesorhizobium sp. YR577]|uniref:TRAP transporter large permease n=1 Tax=Mesorhizobium sp. YR577 TaxID=1884373 RepID=UPI0008ED2868|nr:TRAP transporter large permease subunit [Mesorhizobium sp. YR577]SFU23076.1 TRAP transporter, DctM subunit [Mesorhizobium sp. YR577]
MSDNATLESGVSQSASMPNALSVGLARLGGLINVVILTAMIVVVFFGVIARYAFGSGLPWTEEFAIWCFTWLIFLGAALGGASDRHVAMDMFTSALGDRARAVSDFIRDALIALTLLVLVFSGYQLAQMVGGTNAALQWPNALRYGVIPVSGALGIAFLLLRRADRAGLVRSVATVVVGALIYALVQFPELSPFHGVSASLLMLAVFFATLFLGVPVAFCMVLGVFATTWGGGLLPAPALLQNMVAGSTKFILLAIPFFLTAGYLLNLGGLSARLIDFAAACFGHFRGGLAQVNVFNSVLVGGISGSSGADAASTAKVLVPEMVKRGYPPAFSCAVTAASSILPNVLPPAIAMLVYASVSNVSIAQLFVAGIIPGLMIAVAMMVVNYVIATRRGYEAATTRAPLSVIMRTFVRALPALAIAVVVLGCIRFGVTTATEAGVVALVWAFVLGKFVFRECSWRQLYDALVDCGIDSALIGFLIAASVPFAWVLIAEGLPQDMITWARSGSFGSFELMLILIGVLFIAGMFLDLTPAMLIAAPLFLPLMISGGFDPIHLGIVMIVVLQLGGVTPPVGILVFITAQISRTAPVAIFKEVVPFVVAVMAVLAIVAAVPATALTLWKLIG